MSFIFRTSNELSKGAQLGKSLVVLKSEAMKKQKNKAVITLEDFVFYVIYSKQGGYGNHTKADLRKQICADLKGVPSVKGHRFHQSQWEPISGMWSEGMAEIKYEGVTTAKGIADLVYNGCLYHSENTQGSLSEFGHLPAVSLATEYDKPYYSIFTEKSELKHNFKDKYYDGIYEFQNYYHSEAYVSPLVFNERIEDACMAAYNRAYKELKPNEKKIADIKIRKIYDLCGSLMDYLHELAEDNGVPMLDKSKFYVDFRQLELFD